MESKRMKNATRCVNIIEWSLMLFISATTSTPNCISLPSEKLETTMEPQTEGNTDISVNSCPAHTGMAIIVEELGGGAV